MTRRSLAPVECHLVGVEHEVLELARRQHGVIGYAQLLAAGLSADAIRNRAARGWLRRRHRGVYLVGPVEPPLARAMAATLACGDGALLSHAPAAVLWGLRPPPAGEMHVTVVGRNVKGPPGVTVHRIRRLHPADATRHRGIPTTSPARTLLDLATTAQHRELERATDEAHIHHHVTDDSRKEHSAVTRRTEVPRH